MQKLKLAAIGCGNRASVYVRLATALRPHQFEITALVDPIAQRRRLLSDMPQVGPVRHFDSADSFFAEEKMADAVIIGTQDEYHFAPAMRAMEMGYDLLLEKPISNRLHEVLELERCARRLKRRVIVCHVLRYTPFYNQIKRIVDEGVLGELLSLNATEGVGPWHQSHSYVRGKWADTRASSPMILAKSCHDLDIISWLVAQPCEALSSFGQLSHFTRAHAPAGAPQRCTDGCPVADTCPYNAMLYLSEHRVPWLGVIMDAERTKTGASDHEITSWLKSGPWGRCVYRCENDAVDHQVVNMRFARGTTATFTMTAFDQGRSIELFGTKARLRGGAFVKKVTGHDLILEHHQGAVRTWDIDYDGAGDGTHQGGDAGLIMELYDQLQMPPEELASSIHGAVESHMLAWAAEKSRHTGQVIDMGHFYRMAE